MKASQLRARYWRIVFFFGRVTARLHLLGDLPAAHRPAPAGRRAPAPSATGRTAVRFRALAIRMGGLMIKVGQFLSARLDVLPPEITDELVRPPGRGARRGASTPSARWPRPSSASRWPSTTRGSTRRRWPRRRSGRCTARGCARPTPPSTGFADVVVKVQRPYIEQIVEVDLAALRRVGGWLQRYKPISDRADVRALVEEFAATTRDGDRLPGRGQQRRDLRARTSPTSPHVHVPQVVWSLTTRRVLTLEDVAAIKLSDYDAITAAGIDRSQVAAGAARHLHAADLRGRLLPRRPAPRQPVRHARWRGPTRTATATGS